MNADDFGLSTGVNRAVIECHENGIVTSASLLANGSAFADAVERAVAAPSLAIGVHLNVLRGPPLAGATRVPRLARRGRFHLGWPALLAGLDRGTLREIEREYRLQIERILEQGLRVTHLDGEKHHHRIPKLFELAAGLAVEYGIGGLRCGFERPCWSGPACTGKIALLAVVHISNRTTLVRHALASPRVQVAIGATGKLNSGFLSRLLGELEPGTTELCVHPGYVDAAHVREVEGFGRFHVDRHREVEVKCLTCDRVRQAVSDLGIDLVDYGGLI